MAMVEVEIHQAPVRLRRRPLPDLVERLAANQVGVPLPAILETALETRYSGAVVIHFHNGVPARVEVPTSVQARLSGT